MKTQYYTNANINQQAQFFLDQLHPLTAKHKNQILLLDKAALLVIDMQNFFLNSTYHAFIPSIFPIIPKIKKMQDSFLKKGLTVIQTRHSNNQENCGQMYKWWNSLNDGNDPLADIISEIKNPQITTIDKTQYDAFYHTNLEQQLRAKNITQIIITGVMAHLCCETTARSAFTRGFEVFFAIDGTATYNEEFHLAALRNLAHGFAVLFLVDEIVDNLNTAIYHPASCLF